MCYTLCIVNKQVYVESFVCMQIDGIPLKKLTPGKIFCICKFRLLIDY